MEGNRLPTRVTNDENDDLFFLNFFAQIPPHKFRVSFFFGGGEPFFFRSLFSPLDENALLLLIICTHY